MFDGHDARLQRILETGDRVAPGPLADAVRRAEGGRRSLAAELIGSGAVAAEDLLRAVAEATGLPYLTKVPASLAAEVAGLIGPEVARRFGVIPLGIDGGGVSVAAADPLRDGLREELEFVLGREVRLTVADPERVRALLRRHYGQGAGEVNDAAGDDAIGGNGFGIGAADGDTELERIAGSAPVVRFVEDVLAEAVNEGASDVHFEPFEESLNVRLRIDGELRELEPAAASLARPVASRLKVMARLNIAERRVPQDGRIRHRVDDRDVEFRVSTLPTSFGESVVLRVLDRAAERLEMSRLGMPAGVAAAVERTIGLPGGIFVVTGPTGSGKTTTLYSCLKRLNSADAKLLTVEDPVEYEIDGVMQVPVNPGAGLTFAAALRSFLRNDPDIVMVGEIRDLETAQIAVQAALTGHLVLTTLHTTDAPGAVARLLDMGVESYLITAALEAVLAQRLVRRLCVHCRGGLAAPVDELRRLGLPVGNLAGKRIFRAVGCRHCDQTGYSGRFGIFEMMPMTTVLRELVAEGGTGVALRDAALAGGMTSLIDAGVASVLAGETSLEEIARQL